MTPINPLTVGASGLCLTALLPAGLVIAALPAATPAGPKAANGRTAPPAGHALSLLDVMRASVQIPADGIWGAASGDTLSDDEPFYPKRELPAK